LLAQEIDHKRATDGPVNRGIDLCKRGLVFFEHDIFDPMQGIFNPPMRANAMGKALGTGDEGTDKPTALMIGLTLARPDLVETDCPAHPRPLGGQLMAAIIDPHNPVNLSVTGAFLCLPSRFRQGIQSHEQELVQQGLLIAFEGNQKLVATVQDGGDRFF
jgi:hypothetical protein